MRRLGFSVGLFALLAVLVAGCGGGGGEESTAASVETTEATALSKAELIEQGDAICGEVNAAVGAAGSTSTGAGEAVVQVAGLYNGMVERLKELGPPKEESAGYREFIAAAEALTRAEGNVKLAYEREDSEELTAASSEVASALTKFESAARAFGFEKCAEAPVAPSPSGSGASAESGGGESAGGVESGAEEAAPEEAVEAAPEEAAPPVEEESAGGGSEGGSAGSGGSSGGIGPG